MKIIPATIVVAVMLCTSTAPAITSAAPHSSRSTPQLSQLDQPTLQVLKKLLQDLGLSRLQTSTDKDIHIAEAEKIIKHGKTFGGFGNHFRDDGEIRFDDNWNVESAEDTDDDKIDLSQCTLISNRLGVFGETLADYSCPGSSPCTQIIVSTQRGRIYMTYKQTKNPCN